MDGLIQLILYFSLGTIIVVGIGIFMQLKQQKKANKRQHSDQ